MAQHVWKFDAMTDEGFDFDAARLSRLRRSLRRWYERHARDLPWRRTRDAFSVWISEIMLQQTTVTAVVPYYERFLRRFPSVHQLAAARQEDVLREWEGLGYYSRARNIHKTARLLVSDHDGQFPDDVESLMALPGIGRYTAGAIASFAFDQPAPIVEANTLRLYCRLLAYRDDPRASAGQRLLWDFAEHILPRRSPGRFNQALMELGAEICTPTDPHCNRCPLQSTCRAFADGLQQQIPIPKVRPAVTAVTEGTVAIFNDGRYLLRRREDDERWAGLWDFPRYPLDDDSLSYNGRQRPRKGGSTGGDCAKLTPKMQRMLANAIAAQTGIGVEFIELLDEMYHSVTRYRIRLLCCVAAHRSGKVDASNNLRWVRPDRFQRFPLSVTARSFAKLLQERERRIQPAST